LHFRTGAISETFEYDARRRISNKNKIDAWELCISDDWR
jgi:hypothetical protein